MAIKFFNDVAVDSSVLYVDTINDRVGIGTTNPASKLDVAGRAIIGTGNTIGTVDASIIGSNNNATTDTIIDSSTSAVIGDANSGRYGNTVISDRTLRLGRADNVSGTSSNTTGILNFNDFVAGNNAYANFGGFVGYFPPPTSSNNYYFFTAHDKNVLDSVFQAGSSPEAARINMSTSPNFGTNSAGNDSNSIGIAADGNSSAGAGLYFTASQNHTNPSSRGIFTFDARHQNQNATVPNGHSLFEVTSGYGQTKFLIKQVSGSTNVGIGTTNPVDKLQIDAPNSQLRLRDTDDGTFAQFSSSGNKLAIRQNSTGADHIWLTSSGNVGIGTANPASSAKLTVMGNQTFGLPGNGSNTSGRFISIEGNTDSSGEGSGRIFFTEHNSTTASMDNYGMSIGYRGGATTITGASGNSWTGLSQIGNGQWGMWGHNNDATGSIIMRGDRAATYVDFVGNNINNAGNIYVANAIYHQGDTNNYHSFGTDAQYFVTNGFTRLFINSSGNVGIGTINPSKKLDVVGDIQISDTGLSGTRGLYAPGLIGGLITYNPTTTVTEVADGRMIFNLNSLDFELNAHIAGKIMTYTASSGTTAFYNGPSEAMRLTGLRLGIGTTSPGYKLEVSNSSTNQTTLDSLTFRAVSTAYAGTVGVFENTSGINTSIRISDTVDDMYVVSRNGIMGLGPSGGWSSTNLNITSLGLVGIGARNPLDRLHVNGSARVQNGRVKFYEGTTVNRGHVGPNGSLLEIASTYKTIFKTGPTLTEKMRLTDDGRLLLNTPDNASASDARFEMIGTAADATTNFTFKYNGKLGLGDYTPVAKITVVGTTNNVTSNLVQIKNTSNTGSVIDFRNSLNGQAGLISMPTSTTVNYGTTSDHRLKTNVVGLENGIDKVKKLKPSRFEWINDGIVVDGFIAHEVKEVVPEAVTGKKDAVDKDNNPVYQTIDHSKIIPVLTAALQEAIEKIEQLETRIQTLENK